MRTLPHLLARRLSSAALVIALLGGSARSTQSATTEQVPWIVLDRPPNISGLARDPQIVLLPDDTIVACVDYVEPHGGLVGKYVYRSTDRGAHWSKSAGLDGPCTASLFAHDGALWLMGVNDCTRTNEGDVVIRRSVDGGASWSTPNRDDCGLLRTSALGHGLTTVVYGGRIWRAFLRKVIPYGGQLRFHAIVCSASVKSALLQASSWRWSTELPLDGTGHNAYAADLVLRGSKGPILLALGYGDEVLLGAELSADGWTLNPIRDDREEWSLPERMSGANVQYDSGSRLYFAANSLRNRAAESSGSTMCLDALALSTSKDGDEWATQSVLLRGRGFDSHQFVGSAWAFDGDDLVMVVEASFRDPAEPAGSRAYRSGAFFLRVPRFRERTPDAPALWQAPPPK